MYRQGLTSISIPQSLKTQLMQQIEANCVIESKTISTQTLIFSTVRPIGYLYKQINGRTALRLATRQQIREQINEQTGEVKYYLTLENSYRFGKPPVYAISSDLELTATEYNEYLTLTPYDSFHRKETIFIDKATIARYLMTETIEGDVITFTQYSSNPDCIFELPEYIKAVIYAEGDKYEREAVNTQAKWREKQEAAIAARKLRKSVKQKRERRLRWRLRKQKSKRGKRRNPPPNLLKLLQSPNLPSLFKRKRRKKRLSQTCGLLGVRQRSRITVIGKS